MTTTSRLRRCRPGSFAQCSFASSDDREKLHALTNGAIWKVVGGSHDCYLCPLFADGHVETIVAPKDGKFEDLTDWLCEAKDIVFRNGSYEEIKDSVAE